MFPDPFSGISGSLVARRGSDLYFNLNLNPSSPKIDFEILDSDSFPEFLRMCALKS